MSADLVPFDPAAIEAAGDAGALVTNALVESKAWLSVAMTRTDPTPIAEFKAWAATIEMATRQKGIASEIHMDALEMVRRAERGIGVAIRNGQNSGGIRKRSDNRYSERSDDITSFKRSPTEFASPGELVGNGAGIYALTDGVSDEQFDSALSEAKGEGDLARVNVVRKVRGESKKVTADRHELLHGTHHLNSNRIVRETVTSLEGLCLGLPLINYADIDAVEAPHWAASLAESMTALRRLQKELTR